MTIHPTPLVLALVASASLVAVAAPAQAKGDDVVRRGSCTGSTDWKLKVGADDGRLEVEGEIDSNRVGRAPGRSGSSTTARCPPAAPPRRRHRAGRSRSAGCW